MASSGRCMVVVVALCLLVLGDVSVAAESAINCNLGADRCYEACRAKGHWEVTCFACNYFCPAMSTGFIGGGGSRSGTRAPSPTADNN